MPVVYIVDEVPQSKPLAFAQRGDGCNRRIRRDWLLVGTLHASLPADWPESGRSCEHELVLICIRQTMPFNQDYAVKILAFLEDIAVPISDSIVDYLSAFFYEIRDFFSHHDRRNIRICTRYAWHE